MRLKGGTITPARGSLEWSTFFLFLVFLLPVISAAPTNPAASSAANTASSLANKAAAPSTRQVPPRQVAKEVPDFDAELHLYQAALKMSLRELYTFGVSSDDNARLMLGVLVERGQGEDRVERL